jgi:hypothetical protein
MMGPTDLRFVFFPPAGPTTPNVISHDDFQIIFIIHGCFMLRTLFSCDNYFLLVNYMIFQKKYKQITTIIKIAEKSHDD